MNNFEKYYYDYIGATGTYEINEYIDITSNILNSNINITSNNLNNKINITSNFILNRYDKLIKEETENNLINTYIYNSNVGGEIRFYVKNSGIFDINNASGQPYRVKIGTEGKLYLYYNYNAAIGLLETERWVEPVNMLIGHNVALGNLNAITGATDIAVSALIIKVRNIEALVYEANIIRNDDIFYNPNSTYDQLLLAYNKIKASFTYANSVYAGIVGSLGFGITFAIYGFIQSKINSDFIENNLQYQLNSNSNLTSSQRNSLISETFNIYSSNLNDMNNNLSNLNNLNGFINTSNQSIQFIPKLKSNEITLNNKTITKFSLESIDNWVKTSYGWYWDSTLGNLAINATPNIQDFLIVGGQTTIQGDLITQKKFINTNTSVALPSTSASGGLGDKLILKSGGIGFYPYSLGVNTNSLWYSVPSGANHTFYINGNSSALITSSGMAVNGVLNATTLQENSINLSSKYDRILYFAHPLLRDANNNITFDTSLFYSASQCDLKFLRLDGTNSMSGTLNGTTITASSNFVENGQNLSSKYLLLNGINSMSGNLNGTIINAVNNLQENFINISAKYLLLNGTNSMTGVLNGTSGLFNQLYTSNNVNLASPSLGVAGGLGDRIIISSGGAGFHPYSIGRNTNELWFSTPAATSFKFYTAGTNTFTLNPTGNLTVNGTITNGSSSHLYAGGLRINGSDIYNTIYSDITNANIGITLNYANSTNGSINLGFFGGNNYILTIKNTEINFNQRVKFPNGVWNISADGVYRTHYGANDTSYYCCGGGGTTAHMFMNSGYTNVFCILNSGNVGIGVGNPNCRLYINTGAGNSANNFPLRIASGGGAVSDNSGYSTLIGLGTEANGWSKCAIGHARMSAYDTGDIVFLANNDWDTSNCTMANEKMRITQFGNVGINNNSPINISSTLFTLCVGNSAVAGKEGTIVIGRNTGGGATRQFRIGYTSDYSWSIGDYGGNNVAGSWVNQVYCVYTAPVASLFITGAGYVNMQYGYGNGSDIKIKTDIRTIDDALWKVQQLRGVYYKHISEGTQNIGLIAQEVEHIIPEAVFYDEKNDIKCISYQNLIGLLINSIKEQQEIIDKQAKQIENIMDILNRNNIK